jgi:hypothetical protein
MKILKNLDAKKIARAKVKICLVIASVLFVAALIVFPAFRSFSFKHPGLIGVLIGVSGEVYFDWKEEKGKTAKWKRFFMALLVVSLTYELIEASENDKEAANAINLAGQADEHAAETESNNLVLNTHFEALSIAVIRLAHQYDLSTNALAVADAKLAQAESDIAAASSAANNANIALQNLNRHLTYNQKLQLFRLIDASPKGKVSFMVPQDVPDGVILASDILSVFNADGWGVGRVTRPAQIITSAPSDGIVLNGSTNNAALVNAVTSALNSFNLKTAGFATWSVCPTCDLTNLDDLEFTILYKPQF